MNFTAKDVQSLREKTGCGMMDCKKALTEADGDSEKAIELLREKGLAAAAKKASRIAAEGIVDCYVENNIGVIIEVNSETDFVAKNADFQKFVRNCAITIAKTNPADVDALLNTTMEGVLKTVTEELREKILTIGENLTIRRFFRAEGDIVTYVHGGGRIGVLAIFNVDGTAKDSDIFNELGKDICMQIAALNPQYLDKESVPSEVLEKEKEILIAQIKNDEKSKNKPDAIIEKMVTGKMGKYYEANCLLEQEFVKDSSYTVGKYINEKSKEANAQIEIKGFIRYEKGEGLQKREDNFADEVAKMVK